jgi:Na+-driven multidrug efflux pump
MKLIDRGVLALAAPVFAGHLLAFLFGAADTVFVSMLDRESTALVTGIGLTVPLNLLALALGTGLMAGTASYVARASGGKNAAAVARAGRAALALGGGGAAVLGAALLFGADAFIGVFAGSGADAATRAAAREYLLGAAPGYALLVLELSLLGLLVGSGDTGAYGKAMTIGTAVNLILDPLFLFVFRWGVAGAAAATSVATFAAAAFIVRSVASEAERFGFRGGRPTAEGYVRGPGAAAEIVGVGLPQALSLLVVSLSFAFLNRTVASFGPVALNAWVVVGRVEECLLMIGYAVGSACMIMAGTRWGARDRTGLDAVVSRSVSTALSLCVAVVVPYAACAPLLFRAFSGNAAVVAACAAQVRSVSWSTAGVVLSLVAASGLQGMGRGFGSFLLIAVRLGLFLILPVGILSAAGLLSYPLFLGLFAASSVAGGVVSVAALRRAAAALPRGAGVGVESGAA